MVILKGYVRDGELCTDNDEAMVTSAAIIQGSRVTYTSSDGTFYTSADVTLDYVTCTTDRHKTVDYSIPAFATFYDPEGVVSGSLTQNAVLVSGASTITDISKLFMSGALIGRAFSMRSGTYDGYSSIILGNTAITIQICGGWVTSGSGGGWT